jgi:hypothetical protein
MKVTKNHVYVGLIAVAAAGWCFDTFVLGGGAPQAAAGAEPGLLVKKAAPAVPAAAAGPAAVAGSAGGAAMKAASLAGRFAHPEGVEGEVRDAFAPPAAWIPAEARTAAAVVKPAGPVIPEKPAFDVEGYRRAHKLTAVFRMGGSGGTAIIDGKLVAVGRRYEGLTLSAVTNTTATLRGEGGEVVLELEGKGELGGVRGGETNGEKAIK